eukprot:343904_1
MQWALYLWMMVITHYSWHLWMVTFDAGSASNSTEWNHRTAKASPQSKGQEEYHQEPPKEGRRRQTRERATIRRGRAANNQQTTTKEAPKEEGREEPPQKEDSQRGAASKKLPPKTTTKRAKDKGNQLYSIFNACYAFVCFGIVYQM